MNLGEQFAELFCAALGLRAERFAKEELRRGNMRFVPIKTDDQLDLQAPFGSAPAVAAILCRSCGENLTGAIPGSQDRQVDGAHVLIEKVYRAALLGAAPDAALLSEATGAQFRRFVDDLLQLLAWYPSPELSPRFTDPQNLHLSFRTEILGIVGALVMNAAPDSEPNGRKIKSREGLTLWLRVLSLLSQREEELIETASELWPPALRRRLASALDHRERSRSRSSPFRSRFFRPGLKYINSFEFRDLSETVKKLGAGAPDVSWR